MIRRLYDLLRKLINDALAGVKDTQKASYKVSLS